MVRDKYLKFEPLISAALVLACVWLWGSSYLAGRSLFLDEANLALNIAERDFGAFFRRLDYEQYAPPLFLVISKLACEWVGYDVWGLRLVPLLAGGGTLWLAWRLPARLELVGEFGITRPSKPCPRGPVRRERKPPIALAMNDLRSLAPNHAGGGLTIRQFRTRPLVAYRPLLLGLIWANEYTLRYFTEAKQYGWDLFVTLGLVSVALAQPARLSRSRAIAAAGLGAVAVWASMPGVFVLAGIGAGALWRNRRRPDWPAAGRWLLVGACWLISFLGYYFLILRADSLRPSLADWHRPYFFPLLPQSPAELNRAFTLAVSLLRTTYGHTFFAQAVGAASLLAGAIAIFRHRHALGPLALLPVGLAILASGLGQYSLMPRLFLFALPLLWLVSLYGTWFSVRRAKDYGPWLAILLWLPVLAGTRNWHHYLSPPHYDETRELLAGLPPGGSDTVYVSQTAAPATRYYRERAPARAGVAVANPTTPFYYGNNEQSALSRLLAERPESALLLHSHPNPDLARQYRLTALRKLELADYTVDVLDRRHNGWVVRVSR